MSAVHPIALTSQQIRTRAALSWATACGDPLPPDVYELLAAGAVDQADIDAASAAAALWGAR